MKEKRTKDGGNNNEENDRTPVVLRIVDLIREQGKKEKTLRDYLWKSPGIMLKWKYDGSFVYSKHIDGICEFLNTTPKYFCPLDNEES